MKIEAELTVGEDVIKRGKCAIRTIKAGVLANEDQTAVIEHILLERLAIDGTDRDRYDSQNEFNSRYNSSSPMKQDADFARSCTKLKCGEML